jgi:hypothetical protein
VASLFSYGVIMKIALPCIRCGKQLENIELESSVNQPYDGTAFVSYGHYGSTFYDPMSSRFIEINVCDSCLEWAMNNFLILEGYKKSKTVYLPDCD